MREIITVQLGRKANFLGTHFWNTQESYQTFAPDPPSLVNHDIHFRQGHGPDGAETFLPRALIYDFKSEFGTLAKVNALGAMIDDEADSILWNGALTRLKPAPQHEPSPYSHSLLNATEPVLPTPSTTRYFADFASTYYHPRSLLPITQPYSSIDTTNASNNVNSPSTGTGTSLQLSSFEAGAELFSSRDADIDNMDEDVRPWIEECDELQAIQIFTTADDAWSGFASRYVERLRDELGKTCICVWGLDGLEDDPQSSTNGRSTKIRQQQQLLNRALTVSAMSEQASTFIPIALPKTLPLDVDLNRRALWHTSGLLSAAIESMTLPTRLREESGTVPTLRDWQDASSSGGRRTIASLSLDLHLFPERQDVKMRDAGEAEDEEADAAPPLRMELFPEVAMNKLRNRTSRRKTFARIDSFRSTTHNEREFLLGEESLPSRGNLVLERYFAPVEYPLLPNFPRIFRTDQATSARIPLRTALSTSSTVASWVRSLQTGLKFSVGPNLAGEEKEALINGLGEIADTYIEDWESGDESEDDD